MPLRSLLGISWVIGILLLCLFGALKGTIRRQLSAAERYLSVVVGSRKKKTRRERGLFRVGRVVVMVMCG